MYAFQVQPEDPPPEDPRLQAASNRVSMPAAQLVARYISALNMTSLTWNPFLNVLEGLGPVWERMDRMELLTWRRWMHLFILL